MIFSRLRPRSVRTRITLWYAAAMTLVLVLYAAGVFFLVRQSLLAQLDRVLFLDNEEFAAFMAAYHEAVRVDLGEFLRYLFWSLPPAVGLAALGGWFLSRRVLAPVDRMAARAKRIAGDRLSERLIVENPDDEFGRLATAFNETFDRIETSFEELRRFTADASHELRTPLAAIKTTGEVALSRSHDEAASREVIGSMLEEVDRLHRLVEALLTLSRADAGQIKLQWDDGVDLGAMAREVAELLAVLAEDKGQRIVVTADGHAAVRADRAFLRQALLNLVDNAVKYGPAGSAIEIHAHASGGSTWIAVTDQGPGIPPEHRERIFDRFYRIDKARSREHGGAGLGLSIARWAVEAHGGRIELESEAGKGSTFRIVLAQAKHEDRGGSL